MTHCIPRCSRRVEAMPQDVYLLTFTNKARSDGHVEAHGPKGKMFGFPRLRDLIAEHDSGGRSLIDPVLEALHTFTGDGWEQENDITLLTLECFPTRS